MSISQFSAIVIIALCGLALLTTIAFLVISIIKQSKYDNDALPAFSDLNPDQDEEVFEPNQDESASVFEFEDDDLDSEPIGNNAADEILKEMRQVESAPSKSGRFGLFSK